MTLISAIQNPAAEYLFNLCIKRNWGHMRQNLFISHNRTTSLFALVQNLL